MSLKIVRRSIGDITILDCIGRVTLGEGTGLFRDTLRDLLGSGRKKFILNYAGISYQDSAGNGELVSTYTTVTNMGGHLVLLSPQTRMRKLLEISKLYTVFMTFDDEASAIRYLEVCPLHCLCPICGALSTPAMIDESAWPPQTCTASSCGADFTLSASASDAEWIVSVKLTTYLDEYVEAIAGRPLQISIVGRLNLFASSTVSRLWKALPYRVALFRLDRVTEVTPEGWEALLKLISQPGEDEGARISLEGLDAEKAKVVPAGKLVCKDDATALQELASLLRAFQWPARFESRQDKGD